MTTWARVAGKRPLTLEVYELGSTTLLSLRTLTRLLKLNERALLNIVMQYMFHDQVSAERRFGIFQDVEDNTWVQVHPRREGQVVTHV